MVAKFGPGFFTEASKSPFFSEAELQTVCDFVATYRFATNNLGYSKRVLGGILFRGVFLGRSSPPNADTAAFSKCVTVLKQRVRKEFGTDDLQLFSLEYTNQAFAHKSRWHKDLDDGYPYLNVFITLDDINKANGMTTLRINNHTIELKAPRNRWYSFDGNITHCAGAAAKAGTSRKALMAVFRRVGDPDPASAAASSYKAILTRRMRKKKRPKPESLAASARLPRPSLVLEKQVPLYLQNQVEKIKSKLEALLPTGQQAKAKDTYKRKRVAKAHMANRGKRQYNKSNRAQRMQNRK